MLKLEQYQATGYDNPKELAKKLQVITENLHQVCMYYWAVDDAGSVPPKWQPYLVYTSDDQQLLRGMVGYLLTNISKLYSKEFTLTNRTEVCRVLLAVYNALLAPNESTLDHLHKIAGLVNGHGDAWKKVGVVLLTIALFLCGLLPGVIFLMTLAPEVWDKYSPKGLSALAYEAFAQISATNGRDLSRRYNTSNDLDGFFKKPAVETVAELSLDLSITETTSYKSVAP